MTPGAVLLALIIGLSMGVLGGGGSIIAVPALTFLLHFPPKDAVVTSLAIVGAVAAIGAIGAIVRGAMPLALAAVVGVAATAGSYAGGIAGAQLADRAQLVLLATIMLIAACMLWRKSDGRQSSGPPRTHLRPLIVLGVSVGAITGLVGVGGGFLIVPALVLYARQPMQQAAAASLFVIALAALAAIPAYAGRVTLDWSFIALFVAIGACGVVAGGAIARHLPQRRLQQAFAAALVVLASYLLTQA
ncbi:MAG: sulfite exporter TauE/SafE family protein [Vicinamibacterales bacterium]